MKILKNVTIKPDKKNKFRWFGHIGNLDSMIKKIDEMERSYKNRCDWEKTNN